MLFNYRVASFWNNALPRAMDAPIVRAVLRKLSSRPDRQELGHARAPTPEQLPYSNRQNWLGRSGAITGFALDDATVIWRIPRFALHAAPSL